MGMKFSVGMGSPMTTHEVADEARAVEESGFDYLTLVDTPVGPEYSCCLGNVVMMESVNDWKLDNLARLSRLYGPTVRCILVQGPVRSPRMVITQIRR